MVAAKDGSDVLPASVLEHAAQIGGLVSLRLWSRGLDLLGFLAASERPVPAAALGASLNLSARMVRTSLASTERWLHERSLQLKRIPGRGYQLAGPADSRRRLAVELQDITRPRQWVAVSTRTHLALLTLFFAERPPQLKQLQQVLGLGRTTTIGVIDAAARWLQQHNLRLLRRQNVGCMVVGDEAAWRLGAVSLLRECCTHSRLLATLRGTGTIVDDTPAGRTVWEDALARTWQKLDLPLIRHSFQPVTQEVARSLSDQSYIELCLHAALAVYRCRLGHTLEVEAPGGAVSEPPRQAMGSTDLAAKLTASVDPPLPASELAWIAQRLPVDGASASAPYEATRHAEAAEARAGIVDQMILDASLALHPSLRTDAELRRHLTAHLQSLLEQQPPGGALPSPLLRDVKGQYPLVYAVAGQNSRRLSGLLGRDLVEPEIADIAACLIAAMERLRKVDRPRRRVLVVCSEGAVTAWLLVSRLRAEFPEVEVVEVISALEFESSRHRRAIDFIVSTIPLKVGRVPVIQVTSLLAPEDCRRLREAFEGTPAAGDEPADATGPHLSDLLTADTIELGVTAQDWREAVALAGRTLLRVGAVEARFVKAMKDVILEHGPYMVIWPGAALLHAPPLGVRQVSMGLINLREPVRFGHDQNDPVSIAIVLAATDNRSHVVALQELNQMMQDAAARLAVSRTVHKSVVLHWVRRYSKIHTVL